MTHENARNGIGKVFTSEIIAIIAEVCAVFMIVPIVGTIIGGLGFSILTVIAVIIMMVGLNKAGKDNERIKKAFNLSIIQLVVTLVFSGLALVPSLQSWIGSAGSVIASIIGLIITYNILYGCAELNPALKGKADSTWKLYMIVIIIDVIILIVDSIINIAGLGLTSSILVIVLTIADAIISIIAYIFFLSFLAKAKNEV